MTVDGDGHEDDHEEEDIEMSSDEDNDEDDDDDYFDDYDDDDEHQINRYLDLASHREMRMVERNDPTLTKLEVGYMYDGGYSIPPGDDWAGFWKCHWKEYTYQ